MKKKLSLIIISLLAICTVSLGTPSTQLWIPSTDFQKFGTFHLGIDNYFRSKNQTTTTRGAAIYDIGFTTGILPFEKFQAEAGVDYLYMGDGIYDKSPALFNLKLGTPEGALFKGSPSIALGGYNFGTKKDLTNYNIAYGLIAKTIPVLGRISAGYYVGNEKVLLNDKGEKANSGVLLSWDRPMTEISDKLWMAVDYQGGESYLGALNVGFSWAFSSNVSVIFGYDIYNNHKVAYNMKDLNINSFTTQIDINF
ncbi:MAG: hypothetical protein ACM3P1_12905 [Candidatus Saccharibacteria bacterium]